MCVCIFAFSTFQAEPSSFAAAITLAQAFFSSLHQVLKWPLSLPASSLSTLQSPSCCLISWCHFPLRNPWEVLCESLWICFAQSTESRVVSGPNQPQWPTSHPSSPHLSQPPQPCTAAPPVTWTFLSSSDGGSLVLCCETLVPWDVNGS